MANEIRERFRERKYSYKNKRKKIKENNEEIKAKNDDSPIKIVLFSPFLILEIIGKGIEKLGIKSQTYEKQEKIIYSLGNYESEINNKIYDIDSLNYNIDLALEDVQKLKKEFKDYFLSYSFKEYDKAYKKIELIEKNIIDNKNKVYLIKEKLIKSKELNRNTLTKVKKLNDKN